MLILAATPIGNIADASARLISTIESAEHIACEDTRVFRQLCAALGISTSAKVYSLHEHNEREKLDSILRHAIDSDLVLLSDAGMPTISDPGYVLVRKAAELEIDITIVPGPSAVLSALAISGLATDAFSFLGFLPRKSGERRALYQKHRNLDHTLIFFESPHRIEASLVDAHAVLGNRNAVVVRELTKKFEEVVRGTLESLSSWAAKEPKGELVLLIEGAKPERVDYEELADKALGLSARGLSLRDACAAVAELTGGSKNEIYERALRRKA